MYQGQVDVLSWLPILMSEETKYLKTPRHVEFPGGGGEGEILPEKLGGGEQRATS